MQRAYGTRAWTARGRLLVVVGVGVVAAAGAVTLWQRSDRILPERSAARQGASLSGRSHAALMERLSEVPGFFDSDNLISNETGYQHPIPEMERIQVQGGAYLGVGPDQNFTYIAHLRPEIAFLVDIRRDALLQHLLFKELMLLATNRMEYLALLLGRPPPERLEEWDNASLPTILHELDRRDRDRSYFGGVASRVRARLESGYHRVTDAELDKVERIHKEFFVAGLDLRYTSMNRFSRRSYPTWRSLLLATDLDGLRRNYLASEESFQFVKGMHSRNMIVPVTADLAGSRGVREIGKYLREQGVKVSAVYLSNVEFYVMRDRRYRLLAENLLSLPWDERSVIIRSHFNSTGYYIPPPDWESDAFSVQLLQRFTDYERGYRNGAYRTYAGLMESR